MTEIDELRKMVEELQAKEQIRDVLYSYVRAMDRHHVEGAKAVYHPDAWDLHWGTFVGNAHDFAEYMIGELRDAEFVIHEITNPLIQLDGDRAFVESRYTSRVRFAVEDAPAGSYVESTSHGRYLDVFERRAGVWKLAHRRLAQDGGQTSLVTHLRQREPAGAAHPYPDDLVFAGFAIADLPVEATAGKVGRFAQLREHGRRAFAAKDAGERG